MKDEINIKLINRLKQEPKGREAEYWDTKIEGFVLRKRTSGKMFYYFAHTHQERLQRIKIGEVDATTLEYARDEARKYRGKLATGVIPKEEERQAELAKEEAMREAEREKTYLQFLDEVYKPYLDKRPKGRPAEIYKNLKSFTLLHDLKLGSITPGNIEVWRTQRRSAGVKESTINRQLNDLSAYLNRAAKTWRLLKANPLAEVERGKVDKKGKIRYLSSGEEVKLRAALDAREDKLKAKLNAQVTFADYLKPAVLLALNTGCRRAEILKLKWVNVDFDLKQIAVVAETTKNNTTRYLPLNDEALSILKDWKKQRKIESIAGYVFSDSNGQPFSTIRTSWENILDKAKIHNFRWHDLRHSFASKLVMADVSLNTVRELLGHSDYEMTLRYAHLAPEHKAAAVAKLVKAN